MASIRRDIDLSPEQIARVRRDLERAIAAKHGGWLSRIIHSLFGAVPR
jgi:hypothetical protein